MVTALASGTALEERLFEALPDAGIYRLPKT